MMVMSSDNIERLGRFDNSKKRPGTVLLRFIKTEFSVVNEVCHDVEIEPKLQPLQGESFVNNSTTTEVEARLDINANGL